MKPLTRLLSVAVVLSLPLFFSHTLLADTDAASKSTDPARGTGMATMPMTQQMQHMREEMAKIHATKNPNERRDLMREHASSMQSMMQMMHGMMAGQGMMQGQSGGMGMMQSPADGTGAGSPRGMGPGAGAMMGRMNMMEQRLNMMQMMMDQMLQHQELLLKETNGDDS